MFLTFAMSYAYKLIKFYVNDVLWNIGIFVQNRSSRQTKNARKASADRTGPSVSHVDFGSAVYQSNGFVQ
jgi:hypothetical protein